jgi:ribonuclease BN (tRNA processing enzyme)
MRLQFIGCGDAFGSGGRFNTCFHVVGRKTNALIDCGATSVVAMNKFAIDRNAIDVIFITHFHADHFAGLPFFILEANYILKRDRPLTIVGPPGLKSRFAELMDATFPGTKSLELRFPLTLQEVDIGKRNDVDGVRAYPFHVVHDDRAGPCLGYRLESENKIVAFICESYTRDKPIMTHMALSSLEKHLDQIRPKRLVLTHMSDDMLARRAEIPYDTAEDGMTIEI